LIRINTKDNHQDKLTELKEMIAVAKLEKMTILEEQVRIFHKIMILLLNISMI
jgi:hypothetical protein